MEVNIMRKILSILILIILLIVVVACKQEISEEPKEVPDLVANSYKVEDAFRDITFNRPLDIQPSGDDSGRLFVVEQPGRIYLLQDEEAKEKELFLNIENLVNDSGNEQGLLGLAFHPDFEENGYFYVNYTDNNGTVISRFKVSNNKNIADPTSELILLKFSQPYTNHNGGGMAFGPDGYLYIATGDGGSGGDPLGHGQNRKTLLGKILRIDVDEQANGLNYTIPDDNPYIDNTEGYREEIYAYGLRNPWRFSFDSLNGNLYAADVGQNAVEEINLIEKGKNYGWNIMEGTKEFLPDSNVDRSTLEPPIYEYLHPLGRSITGGYVYRGQEYKELEGLYIYGDFISGIIWALDYEAGKDPTNIILAESNLRISSFGISEKNELYLTSFDGKVYRLIK
jgi:glucose/arabinose dehydrogenase